MLDENFKPCLLVLLAIAVIIMIVNALATNNAAQNGRYSLLGSELLDTRTGAVYAKDAPPVYLKDYDGNPAHYGFSWRAIAAGPIVPTKSQ